MKLVLRNSVPLSIAAIMQASALAHPGHGEAGAAHYVTEPEHAVVIVAAVAMSLAAVVMFAKLSGRPAPQRTSDSWRTSDS